jgi:hypothetical protein
MPIIASFKASFELTPTWYHVKTNVCMVHMCVCLVSTLKVGPLYWLGMNWSYTYITWYGSNIMYQPHTKFVPISILGKCLVHTNQKSILEPSKPRARLVWKLFIIPNTSSTLVWPKKKFDIKTKFVCSKVDTKPTTVKTLNYFKGFFISIIKSSP